MKADLRARLALLLAVTVAVLCFNHPLWNLGVLVGLYLLLLATRTPLRGLLGMLAPIAPIMALVAVFAAVATPDRILHDSASLRVLWQWGPLRATAGGVMMGVTFLLRIVAMVTVTWAVLRETELDEVLDLAAHWRLPAWLSIMVSSAVAAIPNLARRREQIIQAQQARGAPVDVRNPIRRWGVTVSIMVPLITSSLLVAEDLSSALSARGYGAHRGMTKMRDLRWVPKDIALAAVCLASTVAALVLRLGLGLGAL